MPSQYKDIRISFCRVQFLKVLSILLIFYYLHSYVFYTIRQRGQKFVPPNPPPSPALQVQIKLNSRNYYKSMIYSRQMYGFTISSSLSQKVSSPE